MVSSTTGELETSLVSLIIYKNGDPEQMIEDLQIISNDFKTKIFTNIINMLSFLDGLSENPESGVIIEALEEEVAKARKKTLLYQMRSVLSGKIKGLECKKQETNKSFNKINNLFASNEKGF
jgi:hypothetical protein